MRISTFIFFLALSVTAYAQRDHNGFRCGAGSYEAGIQVKGFKVLDFHGIRYSEIPADSLRKGFEFVLSDTSSTIISLLVHHSNRDNRKEYPFYGFQATTNNTKFLKDIKVGDELAIWCINIKRFGETLSTTDLRIVVTE